MIRPISKQLQIWLDEKDEREFSEKIKEKFRFVSFLDGCVWDGSPVVRHSISECQGPFVYIWPFDESEIQSLPTMRRADGRLEGPAAGVVIQYIRSRDSDGVLKSGTISVGASNPSKDFASFANGTWRILQSICKAVDAVNPTTGEVLTSSVPSFRVGPSAASRYASGLRLKYLSTENYYAPGVK